MFCAYGFDEAGAGEDFFDREPKRADRFASSSSEPFFPKPNFFILPVSALDKNRGFVWRDWGGE